jgi:threonine/homoserine/homoserine lactone efflux protein
MAYIHAIAAGDLEWALYALALLVSVLPDELLLIIQRRGFGFGRRRGSFRLFRVLFALLFTTLLGPIVLVALIAFVAYSFLTSRRRP